MSFFRIFEKEYHHRIVRWNNTTGLTPTDFRDARDAVIDNTETYY